MDALLSAADCCRRLSYPRYCTTYKSISKLLVTAPAQTTTTKHQRSHPPYAQFASARNKQAAIPPRLHQPKPWPAPSGVSETRVQSCPCITLNPTTAALQAPPSSPQSPPPPRAFS